MATSLATPQSTPQDQEAAIRAMIDQAGVPRTTENYNRASLAIAQDKPALFEQAMDKAVGQPSGRQRRQAAVQAPPAPAPAPAPLDAPEATGPRDSTYTQLPVPPIPPDAPPPLNAGGDGGQQGPVEDAETLYGNIPNSPLGNTAPPDPSQQFTPEEMLAAGGNLATLLALRRMPQIPGVPNYGVTLRRPGALPGPGPGGPALGGPGGTPLPPGGGAPPQIPGPVPRITGPDTSLPGTPMGAGHPMMRLQDTRTGNINTADMNPFPQPIPMPGPVSPPAAPRARPRSSNNEEGKPVRPKLEEEVAKRIRAKKRNPRRNAED